MSRVRTAISLFAATSLCVCGLAACQPSATVSTSSRADSQQTTSQTETQSQTTKQDTENTKDTKDSAANSNASPNASQTTTETKPEAKTETTEPEATPAPEPEQATPSVDTTNVSGYLVGVCSDRQTQYPAVSEATLEGNVLTIQGNMSFNETGGGSISSDQSTWVNGPIVLTVDENTGWYASGGDAPKSTMDAEKLLDVVNSHNGLGFIVQADNGYAVSVRISS